MTRPELLWIDNAREIADQLHAAAKAAAISRGDAWHWSYLPKNIALAWFDETHEGGALMAGYECIELGYKLNSMNHASDEAAFAYWAASESAAKEREANRVGRGIGL